MNAKVRDRVKIALPLTRSSDDYPPADWEHLWAIPRSTDRYELDNIPFFATGVSAGDLVAVRRGDDERLIFDRVVQYGGHSTVRVVMFDIDQKEKIRGELARLGCESEGSHIPKLFAVDVPASVNYAEVISFLAKKADEDVLDYEEASIQHRTN